MKESSLLGKYQHWLLPLLIVAIIAAIIISALRDNIHAVIPNQVYRSAQLSPTSIKIFVHFKKIKSIINLRGSNSNQEWYRQELKISNQMHIQHYDIRLAAHHLPTQQELQELANFIQQAPKPLLIHCESGADRSGLASAMALILLKDAPLSVAKKQFSWRYFIYSNKTVGKQVFSRYYQWLKNQDKKKQ